MNKRVFVSFALLAALLAVVIPVWAFSKDGSMEENLAETEAHSKELFVTNCGSCHILEAAGTDGIVGPDLDERLAAVPGAPVDACRVLSAIETGLAEGRMPAGILQGAQAEEVSEYVALVAGAGLPEGEPRPDASDCTS